MKQTEPVWASGPSTVPPLPPLPPLEGESSAEACVVGLGSAGLAALSALLNRGVDAVGVDAGAVGAGASGRNGGFLLAGAPAFHHDAATALGRRRATAIYRLTLAEMERMTADTPEAVRRVGSLRLASSVEEERDCRVQRDAMRCDGLPVEPYDGPEGIGLLFPQDGSLQPLLRCRILASRLLERGARLFERSPVVGVGDGVVAARGGRVRCRRALVTVDGGLELILPELRGRVRSARAQMLATEPTDDVDVPRPVYARWGWDYWQQLPDRRVVLGGFRDAGAAAEWTTRAEPTATVQARLDRFLTEDLGVRAAVTHRWAGCIGMTDNRLPVVAAIRPGVVAAGGYSGTGNVLSAIAARAAVELALDARSTLADVIAG